MSLFRRIWALGNRAKLDCDIDAEFREHLRMRVDANIAKGMSPEQAARDARLRFGNPAVMKERVGSEDAALGLDSFFRDIRYALRGFLKSPGFTAIAILSLALGIGANTAVFQLLDAVRLRALPIQKPQELAELRIADGNPTGFGVSNGPYANFTVPMWQEIRRHHDPFSGVLAWRTSGMLFGRPSDGIQINGLEVSGDFFSILGIPPWQGRLIQPQDEVSCATPKVVVASYAFWQSHMGGQPITSNTTVLANGATAQVLGVTPPGFYGLSVGDTFDLAYPTCIPPNPRREIFIYSVMGRLKPGWTLDRASAWLGSISPGLFQSTAPDGYSAQAVKTFTSFRLAAYPAGSGVSTLRKTYDTSLQLLLAITGLVLLIACANLANLMLARASTRQREIALRMALGATRRRLLRQFLIESGLLAIIGAILGVALAQPLSRLLVASLSTSNSPIQLSIVTDWRVLLFAAIVAIFTCIVFGTFPALRSSSADPITSLKSGARSVTGSRERFSVQRSMVVAQIALSMVLLVAALLFVRSYRKLMTFNPGMRESGITMGFFYFNLIHAQQEDPADFKRDLVDLVRSVPGIQNAAGTTLTPLTGGLWSHSIHIGSHESWSYFTYVSPTYFATMGIPLISGRSFTASDSMSAPLVLIVNQSFVRKYLNGENPIGQIVHVLPEPQYPARTYQIVGTIADTKYDDIRHDMPPQAFVPIDQLPMTAQQPASAIMIASSSPAAIDAVRRAIATRYPDMIMQFFDFQQQIQDGLVADRMMAMLSGFFGLLAIILVAVGLYGVLSYFIAQRSNEIGLRIALGALPWQVIALVLRDTAVMLLIGLFVGTGLALLATRAAAAMLFGLKPNDVATLVFAIALLAAIAILASWLPARKASHLDPVIALRAE